MMRRALLALLSLYRRWISPAMHSVFPGGCRFYPTCSEYAAEAIQMHGAARGLRLAIFRLARCHPFRQGGFDPVPLPVAAMDGMTREHHPLP